MPSRPSPARPPFRRHRLARSLTVGAAAVALTALLSGCLASSIDPPAGSGPLRYRDQVFPNVAITPDLTYGSAPNLANQPVALKLDLYQPTGDTAPRRPAIVWAHGGGFSGGDKGSEGPIITPLVRRGFVVVSINYRLLAPPEGCSGANATGACTVAAGAAINDGQAAVRWLRANAATYRIDPDRIAAGGFSAGAVMATGIGVLSDQPGTSGNPGYSSRVGAWVSVAGGLPAATGVDATDPPGYLWSGTADPTVPYQWSLDTANGLNAAQVPVYLHTTQGGGHDLPDYGYLQQQTANFLYAYLRLGSA